jgi:acyl CoA:acetate/3-ketoacid CoA transferase alpha subunit
MGNCFMRGTTKNFNALMPAACKYAVVEAERIVKTGELDPELVTVPSIFIDAIVQAEG